MDETTRADMEARLGADFSDVRIHSDTAAKASAAEIGARAYTSGSHVVIGEGGGDRHTLAHELTHVIQQRQGPVAGTDNEAGLKVSDPSDRFEREAEANATRALSGPPRDTEADREATTTRVADGTGIQRQIVQQYDSNQQHADSAAFWSFANTVDSAVQWAYNFVVSAPSLGPLATLGNTNGHIAQWLRVWNQQVTQGVSGGVSMQFGYVVETLTEIHLQGRAIPAGYVSQTQIPVGATRPDYLLVRQSDMGYAGAVDITASNSAGHIHGKIGWLTHFPRFCESVYASLDNQTLAMMVINHNAGNTGPMTPQQAAAAQAQAAASVQERDRIRINMKNHFERTMDDINITSGGRLARGGDPLVVANNRRIAVGHWMQTQFGISDLGVAASLLGALEHNPVAFGLDNTASDSIAVAFLNAHGPAWQSRQNAPA
ncbi:eCIS core domain-containing protein [Streptomyces exfoliatus]|uniref:eCIS core domain-containing protein n=1 Tax=Streptomyces exfoliatus TaxID=1905 RepID=UPI003F4CBE63